MNSQAANSTWSSGGEDDPFEAELDNLDDEDYDEDDDGEGEGEGEADDEARCL